MHYIYDCSPGNDALVAILLAAKKLDLVGVTTVCGNASVDQVSDNALGLMNLAGIRDVPLAVGATRPLLQELQVATGAHGESGIGRTLPVGSQTADQRTAVELILEKSRCHDDFALIATGPLTNIATALTIDPTLAGRVKFIANMGGSISFGNSTPVAEYNIWVDPEAAAIVYRSGIPIKMFGLNVTRQAEATRSRLEKIRSIGSQLAINLAKVLEIYRENLERIFGYEGASLHDAVPVAFLIEPRLVKTQNMHVDIELCGKLTRGMTVCDYRRIDGGTHVIGTGEGIYAGRPPNVEVGLTLDVDGFFELVNNVIASY
jgi:purine nucleosidase